MKVFFNDYIRGPAVATALVNSSGSVRRELGEQLVSAAALARFLREHDVTGLRRSTPDDLREVLTLRRRVRSALRASSEAESVATGNALLSSSGFVTVLAADSDGGWQWCLAPPRPLSPADGLAALIGAGLLSAVRVLGHERFRSCAAPDCTGMFVDTSRAGRRRYCTPELCGNRLNVANHRARRRATDATP